jgi:hypothetical protein
VRIGILGATRTLANLIDYIPKANCQKRQMKVYRSKTVLDNSKVKPLVMSDTKFWDDSTYPDIIEAIVKTKSRDWTTPQTAGTLTKGSSGIAKATWTALRGKAYESAEMIGAMLACLSYETDTNTFKDYIISAAPNLLYNTQSKVYRLHPNKGDNDGTQLHSEIIMGEQLLALLAAMEAAQELPHGSNVSRKGLSGGKLTIEVDLFIEKAAMCGGCLGMWNDKMAKASYRVA